MPVVKLIRDGMPNICPMLNRSPGIHVSTLVHELCVGLGHYKDDGSEPSQALLEMGNAIEHALRERFALDDPDRYMQPGELEYENLFGTPDLLDVVLKADCEIKYTAMSSKNGPGSEKFWRYETQLKAYLQMLGWTTGELHVVFGRGDYSWTPAGQPCYRVWRYDFTKAELESNWKMLKQQAARPRMVR